MSNICGHIFTPLDGDKTQWDFARLPHFVFSNHYPLYTADVNTPPTSVDKQTETGTEQNVASAAAAGSVYK